MGGLPTDLVVVIPSKPLNGRRLAWRVRWARVSLDRPIAVKRDCQVSALGAHVPDVQESFGSFF
jgi:hypothetical protein